MRMNVVEEKYLLFRNIIEIIEIKYVHFEFH